MRYPPVLVASAVIDPCFEVYRVVTLTKFVIAVYARR